MSVLCRLIAVLLLALWLPVTQHCGLEAAGLWLFAGDCGASCCDQRDGCSADACAVVEHGSYAPHAGSLKILAPDLVAGVGESRLELVVRRTICVMAPEWPAHPAEWIGTRHFVRRAACSPRAPSPAA